MYHETGYIQHSSMFGVIGFYIVIIIVIIVIIIIIYHLTLSLSA